MTVALLPKPAPLSPEAREPMDRHPAAVYLARLAPGSRRAMHQALDVCADILSSGRHDARTLPWADLRYQHTQAVRTVLAERYAPATVNKSLAALRGVLKECWRLYLMSAENYRRASDLSGIRGDTLPRGRALAQGELRALFGACAQDESQAGARDAALLAVLYGEGLRRSEVVALELADYTSTTGELRVRQGKGRKDRLVYVTNGGRRALEAWLGVRGNEPGPLFCAISKGGRLLFHRITPQVVRWTLLKRAREAGVTMLSPHDLRRTFISDLLDAGADISTVQRLAGHANVQTTARYDRRGEETKRKAAELLHVPYVEHLAKRALSAKN
jgi:site-specific recombinase XerD